MPRTAVTHSLQSEVVSAECTVRHEDCLIRDTCELKHIVGVATRDDAAERRTRLVAVEVVLQCRNVLARASQDACSMSRRRCFSMCRITRELPGEERVAMYRRAACSMSLGATCIASSFSNVLARQGRSSSNY